MKKMIVSILCVASFFVVNARVDEWVHFSFDDAMELHNYLNAIPYTYNIVDIDGQELYDFFKKLYDQNNLSVVTPGATLKIPKIIHQIWLGSSVPESFKELQQSWVRNHLGRDWLYKLWTDEDVDQMTLYNQEFYDETDNFGVKSDILRWELVYKYGGVYADMDFECLKPLDILHYTYDFYTALQPLDTQFVQLGAALFGACPGHPILKHCIETIRNDWHLKGAPKKTGPVHFTKSFYAVAGQNGMKDIAFPAFYFYPLGCRQVEDHRLDWVENGAFAVHWWAKSWMPKTYRPYQFRDIHNDESSESWNN